MARLGTMVDLSNSISGVKTASPNSNRIAYGSRLCVRTGGWHAGAGRANMTVPCWHDASALLVGESQHHARNPCHGSSDRLDAQHEVLWEPLEPLLGHQQRRPSGALWGEPRESRWHRNHPLLPGCQSAQLLVDDRKQDDGRAAVAPYHLRRPATTHSHCGESRYRRGGGHGWQAGSMPATDQPCAARSSPAPHATRRAPPVMGEPCQPSSVAGAIRAATTAGGVVSSSAWPVQVASPRGHCNGRSMRTRPNLANPKVMYHAP